MSADQQLIELAQAKAEIDRLRAELTWYKDNVRCTDEGPCACNYRAVVAEARLAAVVALCGEAQQDAGTEAGVWVREKDVRAAATGEPRNVNWGAQHPADET